MFKLKGQNLIIEVTASSLAKQKYYGIAMNNSVVISSQICFATAMIVAIAMNNTEPINQKKQEKITQRFT